MSLSRYRSLHYINKKKLLPSVTDPHPRKRVLAFHNDLAYTKQQQTADTIASTQSSGTTSVVAPDEMVLATFSDKPEFLSLITAKLTEKFVPFCEMIWILPQVQETYSVIVLVPSQLLVVVAYTL